MEQLILKFCDNDITIELIFCMNEQKIGTLKGVGGA